MERMRQVKPSGVDERGKSPALQRISAALSEKRAAAAAVPDALAGDRRRVAEWRNTIRSEFDGAPDSALFGEEVAAVVLDTSTAVLGFWRMGGRGPNFVRVGKAAKYRKSDLLRYVAEHLRDKTDEA